VALYSSSISALVPGTYVFLWTVSNGDCPSAADTVRITNYGQPLADAGGDQAYCLGTPSITLNGNTITGLGSTAYAYWSQLAGPTQAVFADSTNPGTTVTNLGGGSYFFSWLVGNGPCPEDSDVVEVRILDVQDGGVVDTIRPDSGLANGSIIVATPTGGVAPYLYSLDGLNFVTANVFDSLAAGTYTIYVMDFYGCNDSFTVVLPYIPPVDTVEPPDTLQVPTGFSPNGDGTNDFWEIPGIEAYPDAQVEVYNAWGGLVFRSVGMYQPWNGQRNGQDLPTANYYFILDLKAQGQAIQKGSLTILR
jgi:gliding motility-associated-like protein